MPTGRRCRSLGSCSLKNCLRRRWCHTGLRPNLIPGQLWDNLRHGDSQQIGGLHFLPTVRLSRALTGRWCRSRSLCSMSRSDRPGKWFRTNSRPSRISSSRRAGTRPCRKERTLTWRTGVKIPTRPSELSCNYLQQLTKQCKADKMVRMFQVRWLLAGNPFARA